MAVTRLYQAGNDKELGFEITGHRSEAVRDYKRINECQKKAANNDVNGSDKYNIKTKVLRIDQHVNITLNTNVNKKLKCCTCFAFTESIFIPVMSHYCCN